MKKFTKLEIFYLIVSYFMLFAFVGVLFNIPAYAIAWSVSIFIVIWCTFWFIIYCKNMYYAMKVLSEEMKENLEEQIKENKKCGNG